MVTKNIRKFRRITPLLTDLVQMLHLMLQFRNILFPPQTRRVLFLQLLDEAGVFILQQLHLLSEGLVALLEKVVRHVLVHDALERTVFPFGQRRRRRRVATIIDGFLRRGGVTGRTGETVQTGETARTGEEASLPR